MKRERGEEGRGKTRELKNLICFFCVILHTRVTVIKPGLARRVDKGPGRPGGWTGLGLIKDRLWQSPGQTRANPDETRCFFFFSNVGFETH
jgi:hypothetical protein